MRGYLANFWETKKETLLLAGLLILAVGFYSLTIRQYPLVDADEATYGVITMNMLDSGNFWTLELIDGYWLEKPPLFFWLAAIAVKIFGPAEFAFRLPSVLMSALTALLVYFIVRRLGGSVLAASLAFLILLFSPEFYAFGREARMDPGLVSMIVLAVFLWVSGWGKEKYYFGFFSALAAGILFKNLVALLALPIILIFSVIYKKWGWLKSKYFWWGLAPALIILAPWHIVQSVRYGAEFWNSYLVTSLFSHIATRVGGSPDSLLYPKILWQYHTPWTYVIIFCVVLLALMKIWKGSLYRIQPSIYGSFFSGLIIILGFSFFGSRLSTYILPAFPFLAMLIAFVASDIISKFPGSKSALIVIFIPLLGVGAMYSLQTVEALVTPAHFEEREVGVLLAGRENTNVPVYVLDWPFLETIVYYGNSRISNLSVRDSGQTLNAPFYLVTHPLVRTYFYYNEDALIKGYESLQELYRGQYLVLFYSDEDVTLPVFSRH